MNKTKKRMFLIVGGIVFCASAIYMFLFFARTKQDSEIIIQRNGYGEGSRQESLTLENDEIIYFTVEERKYSKEELKEAFTKGFSWAREHMLLDNVSAEQVRSNLNFMEEIPGGLSAQWISENEDILGSDGTIHNEGWNEVRKESVKITLYLTYQEEMQQEQIYLTICGPILSKEEKLLVRIKEYIKKEEQRTREKESFVLPASIEGVDIVREPPVNMKGGIIVALSIGILFVLRKENRKKEVAKKRREEIIKEYPLFVHRFLLYLGAGMNAKTAFLTMLSRYQEEIKKFACEKNVVYEELYVTMNEINAGVGEKRAYEMFGSRIAENHYVRFVSLLVQNMEKGNKGLLESLADEEERAFSNRLLSAKKAGEEAGTKLLFPMLVLMLVVMLIVMAPAIMQFQLY